MSGPVAVERLARIGVGEEQDPAGPQHAGVLRQRADRVLGVLQEVVGDDEVDRRVGDGGQPLAVVDDVDVHEVVALELGVLADELVFVHAVDVPDAARRAASGAGGAARRSPGRRPAGTGVRGGRARGAPPGGRGGGTRASRAPAAAAAPRPCAGWGTGARGARSRRASVAGSLPHVGAVPRPSALGAVRPRGGRTLRRGVPRDRAGGGAPVRGWSSTASTGTTPRVRDALGVQADAGGAPATAGSRTSSRTGGARRRGVRSRGVRQRLGRADRRRLARALSGALDADGVGIAGATARGRARPARPRRISSCTGAGSSSRSPTRTCGRTRSRSRPALARSLIVGRAAPQGRRRVAGEREAGHHAAGAVAHGLRPVMVSRHGIVEVEDWPEARVFRSRAGRRSCWCATTARASTTTPIRAGRRSWRGWRGGRVR